MSLTYGAGRIELRGLRSGFAGRLTLAFLLAAVSTAARGSEEWLTNYSEAMAAAEETGKPVLTVFTGSDWCQHCRTLERNILETPEFREWAADRVILLMIDLPQEGISSEERKARSRVCIKYGVRSFPNSVLIAPDGSTLASQSGYRGQETSTWLATFSQHTPVRTVSAPTKPEVHSSLVTAVESARGNRKPILVMVSRPGDATATTRLSSLLNDPEFESLASEHFVVARVGQGESESQVGDEAAVAELLGEDKLPPAGVQLVITDDGHTPLFKESAAQEPRGVVTGLRRFLAARHSQGLRR
jgi:thioredoxin-related protein